MDRLPSIARRTASLLAHDPAFVGPISRSDIGVQVMRNDGPTPGTCGEPDRGLSRASGLNSVPRGSASEDAVSRQRACRVPDLSPGEPLPLSPANRRTPQRAGESKPHYNIADIRPMAGLADRCCNSSLPLADDEARVSTGSLRLEPTSGRYSSPYRQNDGRRDDRTCCQILRAAGPAPARLLSCPVGRLARSRWRQTSGRRFRGDVDGLTIAFHDPAERCGRAPWRQRRR